MLSRATDAFASAAGLLPGRGYWETSAGASLARGPFAESELGWHVAPGHTLGAYGFLERGDAGVGVRYRWEW